MSKKIKHKEKRTKSPPDVDGQIGIYYKEKKESQQLLRLVAIRQGHNSIGRVIREAVEQYLKKEDPKGELGDIAAEMTKDDD